LGLSLADQLPATLPATLPCWLLLLVQMKAALGQDSRRLKPELEAAKQMLRGRMAERSSYNSSSNRDAAGAGRADRS
jgi:hypothetical protein